MAINQINFLRFVAAFFILLFHFGRDVQSLAWGKNFWEISNTAVSFFFFLSGFILVYVYIYRDIKQARQFYIARFARIFPLYCIALILMALPLFLKSNLNSIDFILSIFMLQAWVPGYSQIINIPAWAISVQLLFYLLFPFLLPYFKSHRSNKRILSIMFILWIGNLIVHIVLYNLTTIPEASLRFKDFVFYHPITHLSTFILGSFAATFYINNKSRITRFSYLLIILPIVVFLLITVIPNPIIKYHHNGLFSPLFFLIIIGLAAGNESILSKIFNLPVFVKLGDLSYAIYIFQGPVFYYFYGVLANLDIKLSKDQFFWIFIVILVLFSFIIHQTIEATFRKKIKQIFA